MLKKIIICVVGAAVFAGPSLAQSVPQKLPPGSGTMLVNGYVPTAIEWTAAFVGKQDVLLPGSIANSTLAYSCVTINAKPLCLGGSQTLTPGDLGFGTGVATALGNAAGSAGGFATYNQLGSLALLSAAPAGTLTGTTLASNVITSSLTSAAGGSFGSGAYAAAYVLPTAASSTLGGVLAQSSYNGATGLGGGANYTTAIYANPPDTVQSYYTLTTVAGQPLTTFSGASFTSADVGKDLVCTGIGSLEQGYYVGAISGYTSATQVSLSPAPSLAMSGVSQRCAYGSDQTSNLQAAFTLGQTSGFGSRVPGGIYLVNSALSCQPPSNFNNLGAGAPLCQFDPGAVITYAGASQIHNFVSYGSLNSNYSGYLRYTTFGGGTIDGSFNVNNCVYMPFFIQVTRREQTTKNCLQHNVQAGDMSAPASSAGLNDAYNFSARDANYVPVASVTTGGLVTTAVDHGFATGRVVFFTNVSSTMATLSTQYYQITVTGARSFTLNNASLSGVFNSGSVSETMPSMSIEAALTGATNANPTVLTVPSGSVTNGESVFIADLIMKNAAGTGNCIDGVYTATLLSPTTISVPVNATSCGGYSGPSGFVIAAPNWTGSANANPIVEAYLYNANSTDVQVHGSEIFGVRAGVVNNPASSGWDGKYSSFHAYNYFENGELLTTVYAGGANTFTGLQTDCPARFSVWLYGPRNHLIGSEIDCNGFAALPNNETSMVRLDTSGAVNVIGGRIYGATSPAANILQEVSSPNAPLGQYGAITGYSRFMLETAQVSYSQPDGIWSSGHFNANAASGAAQVQAKGVNGSNVVACDSATGNVGLQASAGSGGSQLNTLDTACNYTAAMIYFSPTLITVQQNMLVNGTLTANAATVASLTANGNVTAQGLANTAVLATTSTAANQSQLNFFNTGAGGQVGGSLASGQSGSAAGLYAYTGNSYASTIFQFTAASFTISQPLTISSTVKVGATSGVSCSGAPTASFATINGIVTHC